MTSSKDGCRERLTSTEFINLFKEVSTRPEIYFLLMRCVYAAVFEMHLIASACVSVCRFCALTSESFDVDCGKLVLLWSTSWDHLGKVCISR